jgi:cytochrome c oxidase subunit IV
VAHGDAGQIAQAAHAGEAAHAEHAPGQPAAHAHAQSGSHAQGQQHPLGIYFKIWALLFVLSIASYLVDYFHLQGFLRWFLIVTFMLLKAGLIVAIFMHMLWERLALVYAIVVPPLLLLVLLGIGALEADYTFLTRGVFFSGTTEAPAPVQHK